MNLKSILLHFNPLLFHKYQILPRKERSVLIKYVRGKVDHMWSNLPHVFLGSMIFSFSIQMVILQKLVDKNINSSYS